MFTLGITALLVLGRECRFTVLMMFFVEAVLGVVVVGCVCLSVVFL